jgi:hypothetical protein
MHPVIATFACQFETSPPLSPRPASAVISTLSLCRLDLPPLSSRPQGEIFCSKYPPQKFTSIPTTGDFSLRFEMTG